MSDRSPQNYANHARYVPLYHFVLLGLVALYLIRALHEFVVHPAHEHLVELLLALILALVVTYIRVFPIAVQNRVIRLEEQLRYQRVLPPDLLARSAELSTRQVVGLRFASDGELPELLRRALDEGLTGRQIKQAVKHWRADHLRA